MRQASTQQERTEDKSSVPACAQEGNDDIEAIQPNRLEGRSVDNTEPSNEEISQRAFQLWEERGRPEGSQDEDWFRAENELRHQSGDAAVKKAYCAF